ncbi:MAG: hypothetical protein ABIH70_05270 [Chloroflexota bacterium]
MARKNTRLVCDRCGFELTDEKEIELALEGKEAWQNAARGRGVEPRGVIPCKYFASCNGEMTIVIKDKKKSWWRRAST